MRGFTERRAIESDSLKRPPSYILGGSCAGVEIDRPQGVFPFSIRHLGSRLVKRGQPGQAGVGLSERHYDDIALT